MRYALVLLLAGPALAQGFEAASKEMEAELKAGDELRAKGDVDGALARYRQAASIGDAALARDEGRAAEAKAAAAQPVPTDDGTPEGRKRVIAYYLKLLRNDDDEVRYNAVATLGEMRAVEARDALLEVLAKDSSQVARRAAAWALGRLGKEGVPAIPALIREIGGESALLGNMCERALGSITKDALGEEVSMGFRADMSPAERLEVQKKWQDWLGKNRERLKLGPPGPPQVEKPAEPGKR
jgi:hypothetical protein